MKPPICRSCGKSEFGHLCLGPAAGAALAAAGMTPALAGDQRRGEPRVEKATGAQQTPAGAQRNTKRAAVADPEPKRPEALEAAVDGPGSSSETKARQSAPASARPANPASRRSSGQTRLNTGEAGGSPATAPIPAARASAAAGKKRKTMKAAKRKAKPRETGK